MTYKLELSEELYQRLQEAADDEGVSPSDWIGARLPSFSGCLPERNTLARYLGGFDSSLETKDPRYCDEFGDIVAEKLRKQGLEIP